MEKEKIIKEIRDIISHHENTLYYSIFVSDGKIEIDYDKLAEGRIETWEKIRNLFN